MAGKQSEQTTILYTDHCIGVNMVNETNQDSFKMVKMRNTLLYACAVLILSLAVSIGVIGATVVVLRTAILKERCNSTGEPDQPTYLRLPEIHVKQVPLPDTAFHFDSFMNWTIISTEHIVNNQDVLEVVQVDVNTQVKITTIADHDGNISTTIIEDPTKELMVFKDHLSKTCLMVPFAKLPSNIESGNGDIIDSEGIIQAHVAIQSHHLSREFGNTIADRCIDSRNFRAIWITPSSSSRRQRRQVWNGNDDLSHVVGGSTRRHIPILCCRCITSPCPCELISCPHRKSTSTL